MDNGVKDLKGDASNLTQTISSYSASIKHLEAHLKQ